jgi:hypothetical protein
LPESAIKIATRIVTFFAGVHGSSSHQQQVAGAGRVQGAHPALLRHRAFMVDHASARDPWHNRIQRFSTRDLRNQPGAVAAGKSARRERSAATGKIVLFTPPGQNE